jgi:hypothetical protein
LLSSASGELMTAGTAKHWILLSGQVLWAMSTTSTLQQARPYKIRIAVLGQLRMPYIIRISPEHPERKSSSSRHRETPILVTTRNIHSLARFSKAMSASPHAAQRHGLPHFALPSDKFCPAEIQALGPLKRCGPSPRASPPGLQSRPISPRTSIAAL